MIWWERLMIQTNEFCLQQFNLFMMRGKIAFHLGAWLLWLESQLVLFIHYASKEQLLLAVTQKISHQISKQARTTLKKVNGPEEELLALADVLLIQFQTQPNLMNFLFFNPTAQWQKLMKPKTDFELLDLTYGLIDEILTKRQSGIDPQRLFIQIWSFIQGYGLLIKNKIVSYDKGLVSITLNDYLGGD